MRLIHRWLKSPALASVRRTRLDHVAFSIADQGFSVGGMFLANVALARAASKEEYGMFTLAYSVFNFLTGLHNAAILEPYTVYGAGRYRNHTPEYRWLIWRSNAWLGVVLTALLLLVWLVLTWTVPSLGSRSMLGLAVSCAIILTSYVLRRLLYIERKVGLAAKMSFVFLLTLTILLGVSMKRESLDGMSVFIIVALASIAGCLVALREVPRRISLHGFYEAQPGHWSEHWKYARWVLATAFVFQLANQAYYWLVAGLLSLKEVAELRAITMIVMAVDQVFIAITFLVLPMLAARYASKQIGELFSLWKVYLLAFLLIGGAFVAAVLLLGGPVMHWIYGGKFDDVAGLLPRLALLPVLMGIGHTMNVALKSVEKPNMVFYAYVASGATTFAVGIPLMIHLGLRGAAYGMLMSAGVYTVTLGIAFLRHMPRLHRLGMANRQEEVVVGQSGAA
jgi:O-antigen/teichoic acid export membrane protein